VKDAEIIDAKFKVIRQPKRRWRIWIDWRVLAVIGALAAASMHAPH
jgi:exosome complex RNA-binding protein Rrp42 (RNase PH superfamily)